MKKQPTRGFWFGFNTMAIVLIVCFLFFAQLISAFEGFAHTVDMSLQKTTQQGIQETVDVTLSNVQQTPLNAVEFELHFNPKEMTLSKITPTASLCEDRFIITNTINNASGTALFQCGTITPFSNKVGTVATIDLIRLIAATTSLSFGTTTHVLAHDGYGTDATRAIQDIILTSL